METATRVSEAAPLGNMRIGRRIFLVGAISCSVSLPSRFWDRCADGLPLLTCETKLQERHPNVPIYTVLPIPQ